MPQEDVEQREDGTDQNGNDDGVSPPQRRRARTYFSRRNVLFAIALAGVLAVILAVLSVVSYRYGVFDTYIKAQFVSKMADMGIVFDADVFRVTITPLQLELKNATFNDRVSGDRLFFIRDARLGLTVQDLYSWQLSRAITVDTTDINGAEVWVKFDDNGRSNFSNLQLVEQEPGSRVNFKYGSVKFALKDSVVHFGNLTRKIDANANNIQFFLEPEDSSVPDDQKRYRINLSSTDSDFTYDERRLDDIDIRVAGIADRGGAEIAEFRLETPIGVSTMSGSLTDWASLKYDLNIESTVDLTQTTSIFPLGSSIRGVGNFKGRVSGEGENYRVEGIVDSESLTAEGVYLKGVNVSATVQGTNTSYDANGTAVAELLTFEDFRVEFPKLAGNVRGTGTDFRWMGDLQAVAASSKSLTVAGLFLSDAVAEMKDRELLASAANGRAQRFSVADSEFETLTARDLKFSRKNGVTKLESPGATAAEMRTKAFSIQGVSGKNVRVRDEVDRTNVDIDGLRASSANIKNTKARQLSADKMSLTDLPRSTDIDLTNLRADGFDAAGVRISGINSPLVTIRDTPAETVIYSDSLRFAKLDADAAVLGSVNIAGVRLTIRQGRIEGTSNDIDAGNVVLAKSSALPPGGDLTSVKIAKPVFVLEPSGRYRASADMSIGGGIVGSVPLGAARADVTINNDRAELTGLTANVMEGSLNGNAVVAFNSRSRSQVTARFDDLDLSKLVALQGGRILPLQGRTNGNVDITFAGTDINTTTGTINANIAAQAGNSDSGLVPVNGRVELNAANGLFSIGQARLTTDKTELNATGRFDLRTSDSNLTLALNSTDASEVYRLVGVMGIAPDVTRQLDSLQLQFAGGLRFNGTLTGNFNDPVVNGNASLDSLSAHRRELGSLTTEVAVSPMGVELNNGLLKESLGGTIAFNLNVPTGGANNTSVHATLTNVNAGNLLAALPVNLPESLRDFTGVTSGTVDLSGLPNDSRGGIELSSKGGTFAGQTFDSLNVKAAFSGSRIEIQNGELRLGAGFLSARGTYDYDGGLFDLNLEGKSLPLPLAVSLLPSGTSVPTIAGLADFTARAVGDSDQPSTFDISFNGTARDVVINENAFGIVSFKGNTANQVLTADLTAQLEGRPQVVSATLNFGSENLPFRVEHQLDRSPLRPFFALIPQLQAISLAGTGTGSVEFGGDLAQRNPDGTISYTAQGLTGIARFSQLDLLIQDSPLNAVGPVVVRFSPREITFEPARFSGGGSNVTIAGTKALNDDGMNDLSIDGRLSLALLNAFPAISASDLFFGGYADVAVRFAGVNRTARVSGTATLDNAAVATFIGSDRLTFERLKGRILFSADQAQIDQLTGYLGGGQFTASGGALFGNNLQLDSFRVGLTGTNITVPLPEDFITTGDARLEISGRRFGSGGLSTLISGQILARRSLYTQDIELANIVGARREASLSGGGSSLGSTQFDLTVEGRDALVIRNNIADLTASASLRVTGTTDHPQISGRITANSGTVFFRKDRYIVQRGVLDFPPNTEIDPIITLQAESEIAGYQIFVNLSGPLTDTELLNASVRSSPALPQADVISLITTGNLSNTESGIPTLAQTGINTVAEVLADSIINNPARKATDKLFGLNVFEIDPIISGERLNPSARLTVGRQINNNLRVTYATNLSQDQNQVLALEYRVSNKLSFVAQYEQRSLSNVTRNRDNFSFEIRFRRRF
ncbi:MAG: translocation/assembly module TamB domain-containing protein [Acidobacteriota bacterium]